jgi:hypothetical protein
VAQTLCTTKNTRTPSEYYRRQGHIAKREYQVVCLVGKRVSCAAARLDHFLSQQGVRHDEPGDQLPRGRPAYQQLSARRANSRAAYDQRRSDLATADGRDGRQGEPLNSPIARRFAESRGIFRTEYEGKTLRENLGVPYPRSHHAGQ